MKKTSKASTGKRQTVTNKQDTLSLTTRYDLLVHIMDESPLSKEERLKSVKSLFPLFDEKDTKHVFESKMTNYVIEVYSYYRALGMSVSQAAHAAEVSNTLLERVMEGEGITLSTLLSLAKSELFTAAETKGRHLKTLDTSSERGATVTFLEKIYPKEYTQKGLLDVAVEEYNKPKKWEVEITHVENKIGSAPSSKENDGGEY